MEGTPVNKTPKMPGSFTGVPQTIRQHITRSQEAKEAELDERAAKQQVAADEVVTPPAEKMEQTGAGTEAPKQQTEDDKRAAAWNELVAIKEKNERLLGIKIEPADIESYLFRNGYVKKSDISVVPGKMLGTMQTLTGDQSQKIESDMAEFQQKNKFATPKAVDNERTLRVLAFCWLEAKNPGKPDSKYRALGQTPEERYKTISQMGALTVDFANTAYSGLMTLLNIALSEDDYIKKS